MFCRREAVLTWVLLFFFRYKINGRFIKLKSMFSACRSCMTRRVSGSPRRTKKWTTWSSSASWWPSFSRISGNHTTTRHDLCNVSGIFLSRNWPRYDRRFHSLFCGSWSKIKNIWWWFVVARIVLKSRIQIKMVTGSVADPDPRNPYHFPGSGSI